MLLFNTHSQGQSQTFNGTKNISYVITTLSSCVRDQSYITIYQSTANQQDNICGVITEDSVDCPADNRPFNVTVVCADVVESNKVHASSNTAVTSLSADYGCPVIYNFTHLQFDPDNLPVGGIGEVKCADNSTYLKLPGKNHVEAMNISCVAGDKGAPAFNLCILDFYLSECIKKCNVDTLRDSEKNFKSIPYLVANMSHKLACEEPYRLLGNSSIICDANALPQFDATVKCVNSSHWCNFTQDISPRIVEIPPNDTANLTCQSELKRQVLAKCLKGFLYVNNTLLQDYCRSCPEPDPRMLDQDVVFVNQTIPPGSFLPISCKNSLLLHGIGYIECTNMSKLIYPKCYTCSSDENFCFPLEDPDFIMLTNTTRYLAATNQLFNISCNSSVVPKVFSNKKPILEVSCQKNMTYLSNNARLQCYEFCNTTKPIENATLMNDSNEIVLVNEKVKYSCKEFHRGNATNAAEITATCRKFPDVWEVEEFCVFKFCQKPNFNNLSIVFEYPNNGSIIMACNSGYKLNAQGINETHIRLDCISRTLQWSASPRCELISTTTQPTTISTTVKTAETTTGGQTAVTSGSTGGQTAVTSGLTGGQTAVTSGSTGGQIAVTSVSTGGETAVTSGPTGGETAVTSGSTGGETTVIQNITRTLDPIASVLPKLPTYEVKYDMTSDIYYSEVGCNASSDVAKPAKGPFGFGVASAIMNSSCVHIEEMRNKSGCLFQPQLCPNGLSLSLWIKYTYTENNKGFTTLSRGSLPKSYIFSSGGDVDGTPGIAIYLEGLYVVAQVITNTSLWETAVIATIKSDQWTNVALRWKPNNFSASSVKEMGGLELLIQLKRFGYDIDPSTVNAPKNPISPPEVMFGCHRSTGDKTCRGYFEDIVMVDEFVFWTHYILDNETLKFLGGYEEKYNLLQVDDVKKIMDKADFRNPEVHALAVNYLAKLLDTPVEVITTTDVPVAQMTTETMNSNVTKAPVEISLEQLLTKEPTTSHQDLLKMLQKSTLQTISDIIGKMTKPESIRRNQTESDFKSYMSILSVFDKILGEGNQDLWKEIQTQKNNSGAAGIMMTLANYVLDNLQQIRVFYPKKSFQYKFSGGQMDVAATKYLGRDLKAYKYIKYPGYLTDSPDLSGNSALIPCDIFTSCQDSFINVVFIRLIDFNKIAPIRVNPLKVDSSVNSSLDSEVFITKASVSMETLKDAKCRIDDIRLKKQSISLKLSHKDISEAKYLNRRLLFFDEKLDFKIRKRSCVLWNPNISDYGSWDPTDCGILKTDPKETYCMCQKFGIVGILAEHEPPMFPPKEPVWLMTIKYILYGLSILCLIAFIVTVWSVKVLREQFHVMRMNLAVAVLVALIATILSDFDYMRQNRIPNIIISSVIQVFYLAAASLLWIDGWACFKAIIYGVIGGMLKAYIPLAWGISAVFLGISYLIGSSRYGTNLSCFISTDRDLQLCYFGPLFTLGAIAVIVASVVHCNLGTAAVRNEVILLEIASISKGGIVVIFYFFTVWVFGFLTFYSFDIAIPNFRPLFQILNSAIGIVIFVFMGLYSPRFMDALRRNFDEREKFLLDHAVNTQQRIKEERKRHNILQESKETLREDSSDDMDDSPILRRKRIVAG